MNRWIDRKVSSAKALSVVCEDCGRPRTFDQHKLHELHAQGLNTFRDVGSRLRCKACKAKGGDGRNIDMRPIWS